IKNELPVEIATTYQDVLSANAAEIDKVKNRMLTIKQEFMDNRKKAAEEEVKEMEKMILEIVIAALNDINSDMLDESSENQMTELLGHINIGGRPLFRPKDIQLVTDKFGPQGLVKILSKIDSMYDVIYADMKQKKQLGSWLSGPGKGGLTAGVLILIGEAAMRFFDVPLSENASELAFLPLLPLGLTTKSGGKISAIIKNVLSAAITVILLGSVLFVTGCVERFYQVRDSVYNQIEKLGIIAKADEIDYYEAYYDMLDQGMGNLIPGVFIDYPADKVKEIHDKLLSESDEIPFIAAAGNFRLKKQILKRAYDSLDEAVKAKFRLLYINTEDAANAQLIKELGYDLGEDDFKYFVNLAGEMTAETPTTGDEIGIATDIGKLVDKYGKDAVSDIDTHIIPGEFQPWSKDVMAGRLGALSEDSHFTPTVLIIYNGVSPVDLSLGVKAVPFGETDKMNLEIMDAALYPQIIAELMEAAKEKAVEIKGRKLYYLVFVGGQIRIIEASRSDDTQDIADSLMRLKKDWKSVRDTGKTIQQLADEHDAWYREFRKEKQEALKDYEERQRQQDQEKEPIIIRMEFAPDYDAIRQQLKSKTAEPALDKLQKDVGVPLSLKQTLDMIKGQQGGVQVINIRKIGIKKLNDLIWEHLNKYGGESFMKDGLMIRPIDINGVPHFVGRQDINGNYKYVFRNRDSGRMWIEKPRDAAERLGVGDSSQRGGVENATFGSIMAMGILLAISAVLIPAVVLNVQPLISMLTGITSTHVMAAILGIVSLLTLANPSIREHLKDKLSGITGGVTVGEDSPIYKQAQELDDEIKRLMEKEYNEVSAATFLELDNEIKNVTNMLTDLKEASKELGAEIDTDDMDKVLKAVKFANEYVGNATSAENNNKIFAAYVETAKKKTDNPEGLKYLIHTDLVRNKILLSEDMENLEAVVKETVSQLTGLKADQIKLSHSLEKDYDIDMMYDFRFIKTELESRFKMFSITNIQRDITVKGLIDYIQDHYYEAATIIPVTDKDIEREIINIVAANLGISADKLTPESYFYDLETDMDDIMRIFSDIQQLFNIRTDEIEKNDTLSDVIEFVKAKLEKTEISLLRGVDITEKVKQIISEKTETEVDISEMNLNMTLLDDLKGDSEGIISAIYAIGREFRIDMPPVLSQGLTIGDLVSYVLSSLVDTKYMLNPEVSYLMQNVEGIADYFSLYAVVLPLSGMPAQEMEIVVEDDDVFTEEEEAPYVNVHFIKPYSNKIYQLEWLNLLMESIKTYKGEETAPGIHKEVKNTLKSLLTVDGENILSPSEIKEFDLEVIISRLNQAASGYKRAIDLEEFTGALEQIKARVDDISSQAAGYMEGFEPEELVVGFEDFAMQVMNSGALMQELEDLGGVLKAIMRVHIDSDISYPDMSDLEKEISRSIIEAQDMIEIYWDASLSSKTKKAYGDINYNYIVEQISMFIGKPMEESLREPQPAATEIKGDRSAIDLIGWLKANGEQIEPNVWNFNLKAGGHQIIFLPDNVVQFYGPGEYFGNWSNAPMNTFEWTTDKL
ncbi:acyl carrier protein, partial [Elusimicrobiota bacterium]